VVRAEDSDQGLVIRRARIALGFACLLVLIVGATQSASGASNGQWIVFSAYPDGVPPAQLFRIQTNGEGLQQITKGKFNATDPTFAPDGKRIVFARLGSGIFVANLDGSGARRLTSGKQDTFPGWSPDGTRIAFLRQVKGEWRLFVMKASGRDLHRLKHAPPSGRPTWSANSKSIFVPTRGALEQLDARTGRVLKHVTLTVDVPISGSISPDGRKVAFVGSRPSLPGCGEVSCVVFALYLGDLTRTHGRTQKFTNDGGPAGWSPNGKTLVFVYRGALTFWPVGGKAPSGTLATGAHVAQADAPPAWQPR
jgi:Tol biopolymer transport system component